MLPQTWKLFCYCGDWRTGMRYITHQEGFEGTALEALQAAHDASRDVEPLEWAAAASDGPDIEEAPGWKTFSVTERRDGRGWTMEGGGLSLWDKTRESGVSYAMHRGAPHITLVRIWTRDGRLQRVILGSHDSPSDQQPPPAVN